MKITVITSSHHKCGTSVLLADELIRGACETGHTVFRFDAAFENNLSVDCDCDSNPALPTMKDIGILASLDPVALDQASVDLIYAAPDGKDLTERMESRHGIHTLEHAESLGLGRRKYEMVIIDEAVMINE
jgi:uncharacterized Fe-S center protein